MKNSESFIGLFFFISSFFSFGTFGYVSCLLKVLHTKFDEFDTWANQIPITTPLANQNDPVTWDLQPLVKSIMLSVQRVMEKEKEMNRSRETDEKEDLPLLKSLHDLSSNNINNITSRKVRNF